jgi:hypothetical protein
VNLACAARQPARKAQNKQFQKGNNDNSTGSYNSTGRRIMWSIDMPNKAIQIMVSVVSVLIYQILNDKKLCCDLKIPLTFEDCEPQKYVPNFAGRPSSAYKAACCTSYHVDHAVCSAANVKSYSTSFRVLDSSTYVLRWALSDEGHARCLLPSCSL